MTNNEFHLKEILIALEQEDILKDLILIGSWSLLMYKRIYNDFDPLIATTDIDFYIPNVKVINQKNNILNTLKEINYDEVKDRLTNKSRFISPDGFEIEFLTKLNRNNLSCIKVGNTTIFAESLSYVEIFNSNYIEIDYEGIKINVVSPLCYVLQKLLINSDRKSKDLKDIESIKYVLGFINKSQSDRDELRIIYESLPKKWKAKISKTTQKYNIILF